VQLDSFRDFYASKTDGELLSLAADKNSLVESARLAVADELRRRNLDDLPVPEPISLLPAEAKSQPDHKTPQSVPPPLARIIPSGHVPRLPMRLACAASAGEDVVWFAPIFGTPSNVTPLEWHLRHLAVMTVIISLIAGYIDLGGFFLR